MKSLVRSVSTSLCLVIAAQQAAAQTFTDAMTGGDTSVLFNLRYEDVSEDNALEDASALTLRTALTYSSEAYKGFSFTVGAEDVRIVGGVNDFSVPPSGFNTGQYSVIADPEHTEIDQGFIQYASGGLTAKLGRQIINYDNMRFIGAVPWRQDFQVFDALTLNYKVDESLTLNYNYLDKRNRIFADDADQDSKDHLFNVNYRTGFGGTLVGYAYLLETDNNTDNSLDTWGVRLTGSGKLGDMNATYLAEYARQSSEAGASDFDADYFILEGGLTLSAITAKLGYESLGSDDGMYGFSTPLATLHAFNGWADQFLGTPAQGIDDLYLSLGGKVLGGNWTVVFHDYDANDSSAGVDDLGSEVNLQWVRPINDNYTFAVKFADYSDGDLAAKVDKTVFWTWFQARF